MHRVDRGQTPDLGGDLANTAALNFDHDPEVKAVANFLPIKDSRNPQYASIVERPNSTSDGYLLESNLRCNRPVGYSTIQGKHFHDLEVRIVKGDAPPPSALLDRRISPRASISRRASR
jgi:hypothetical protein